MQRRGIQPEWSFDFDVLSKLRDLIAHEVDSRKEQCESLERERLDSEAERASLDAAVSLLNSEEEREDARTSPFLRPYDETMRMVCEDLPRSRLEELLRGVDGRIARNKSRVVEVVAALRIAEADLGRVETMMKCPQPRILKNAVNPAHIF